jgi:hypothetical protein
MSKGYFDYKPCDDDSVLCRYWSLEGKLIGQEMLWAECSKEHGEIMMALGYAPKVANENFRQEKISAADRS